MLNFDTRPRAVFGAISSNAIMAEFLGLFAPTFGNAWMSATRKKRSQALLDGYRDIRRNAPDEQKSLARALRDFCDVCNDDKTELQLLDLIDRAHLQDDFRSVATEKCHNRENAALFLMLRSRVEWDKLVNSAAARSVGGKWDTFHVRESAAFSEDPEMHEAFRGRLGDYLPRRMMHGEYVHVFWDITRSGNRAYISVNRIPGKSEQ